MTYARFYVKSPTPPPNPNPSHPTFPHPIPTPTSPPPPPPAKTCYPSRARNTLEGAWRDRDVNDISLTAPLFFTFLTSNFPTLFVLVNFIRWSGHFLKNSFRKSQNVRKTTQNALSPSTFIVLSIVLKLGTPLLHNQAENTLLENFLLPSTSRHMDEKPPKTIVYPTHSGLTKHNFFRRSKLKKSVTSYFTPCIGEDIKKKKKLQLRSLTRRIQSSRVWLTNVRSVPPHEIVQLTNEAVKCGLGGMSTATVFSQLITSPRSSNASFSFMSASETIPLTGIQRHREGLK